VSKQAFSIKAEIKKSRFKPLKPDCSLPWSSAGAGFQLVAVEIAGWQNRDELPDQSGIINFPDKSLLGGSH